MESSLKKHVKIHDGVVYKCRVKKKCDYKNTDIRNVRAHEKTHSKILGYGFEKCGKTFKYWMQMDRQVKGKKVRYQVNIPIGIACLFLSILG